MKRKNLGIMELYFTEIRRYPLLTREQEVALARQAQEGRTEARDRLIECNQRFVVKVAHAYRGFGMPVEDLVNEGNLGLIEAIRRFDPDRAVRFVHWASWWIQRSIRRALSEQSHTVRIPESTLRKMRETRETVRVLTGELGRKPTQDEIAQKLTDPKLIHLKGILQTSLDEPVHDDRADTLATRLEDGDQISAEDHVLRLELTERVRKLYERLEGKERIVISCRYGFDDGRPESLDNVAKRIGRSREGVRFIERRAIRRLARRLTGGAYESLEEPESASPPSGSEWP